ncbi:MAG: ABC transporter ATP-binding protein, partial [Coriobacteriia bacterium]|nr:ABC transporter ATP-binding protein [Coriobacteriia bacterium]MBN2840261.1 ABC transporter ATP-binding protein [Coriobacteriia bacterium]
IAQMPGVFNFEPTDGQVRFDVDADHVSAVVSVLAGLDVRAITSRPPTLEQLLLRHYGDEMAAYNGDKAEVAR